MDKTLSALWMISLLLALAPRVFPQFIAPRHARWFLPAALILLGLGMSYALVQSFFWFSQPPA